MIYNHKKDRINHISLCKFHPAYNLMGSVHNILVWKYRRKRICLFRLRVIYDFFTRMLSLKCCIIRYFIRSFLERYNFYFGTTRFSVCSCHILLPFHKTVICVNL
nr:MAG TPA: hypothetical protein [Caudoviricetes sp.]